MYHPTLATVVFITLFLGIYMLVILKKTIRRKMDLYDLLILSSVALIPAIFVYFPTLGDFLAGLTGVLFPFILIFGALFLIIFTYIYRSMTQHSELKQKNTILIQEVSLLKNRLEQVEQKFTSAQK